MTVLLAIENCDMDEVVTFSADAVFKMREILPILPGILEKTDDGAVSVCGYAGVCQ